MKTRRNIGTDSGQNMATGSTGTYLDNVPSDWAIDRLAKTWDVIDCKHITADFVLFGTPVVSIREVQSRFVDIREAKQTTEAFYVRLIDGGRKPSPGDLILSRNATVGEVAQVADWHPPLAMGQDVCLLRKKSQDYSSEFLRSVFKSDIIGRQLENLMVGSTFRRVNVRQIKSLLVPMPSPLEQRAIAAALSDVDELIGALDNLIAKKRAIKLAAMQQLLTGKTRVPGFNDEWTPTTLGELADIQRGASPRPIDSPVWYDPNSGVGWVRISDIADSDGRTLLTTRDYLSPRGIAASRFLPAGTLIMSICATVGRPVITGFDTCIHDGFVSLSHLRRVDLWFLFYKLKELEPKFNAMGQTGSQANLNTDLVKGCELRLPPLDEQSAIVRVLSDMDAEIAALEQRRDKTQAIKQGMMQALLTGRVRLMKPERAGEETT